MRFLGGENRILFQGLLVNAPNVTSIAIYWNNEADSLIVPVTSSAEDAFIVEASIEGLAEGSYMFDVRTRDKNKNQSLKLTGVGNSYGEVFRQSLVPRVITAANTYVGGTVALFSWGPSADNLAKSELRYTTVAHTEKVVTVPATELMTPVTDAAPGSTFEYRSAFRPEPTAIDAFYMDWEATAPVYGGDNLPWKVISWSSQNNAYPASSIIDGITNTAYYWHSQWSPQFYPPHWAIIDLVLPMSITQIETYRALGRTSTKTVQYFVSDDPDPNAATWVQIGSNVMFPITVEPQMLTTDIPSPNPANKRRYLKIYQPDSNDSNIQIAEVVVHGTY
jgi:hypothetical protein